MTDQRFDRTRSPGRVVAVTAVLVLVFLGVAAWLIVPRAASNRQQVAAGVAGDDALPTCQDQADAAVLAFDWASAELQYEECLALARADHEPSERITQHTIDGYGHLLLRKGELDRAAVLLNEAYEMRLEYLGERDPDTRVSVNNLGELATLRGDLALAEALHRENLVIRRKILGDEHAQTLESMVNLGWVLNELGRETEADSMLAAAVAVARQTLAPGRRERIDAECHLGRHRLGLGRAAEVERMLAPLVAVADSALVARDPLRGAVRVQLAACALLQMRGEKARGLLDAASDLVPAELTAATPWRWDYLAVRGAADRE